MRRNGTEIRRSVIKTFYRSPASDRGDKGVGCLVIGRVGRAGGREASRDISHTGDFAHFVSDKKYEMLIRADAELVAALRKWGLAQGWM